MLYVMSDIHGNLRRFQSVLAQICLQPDDTLYILGDVIDRHPDGIAILRQIMAAPNMELLLGNHEYMLLRALGVPYDAGESCDPPRCIATWYHNGGAVTHEALSRLPEPERAEIFDYLRALPCERAVRVNGQDYLLVHGAPSELYPDYGAQFRSQTHFSVWKRLADTDALPSAYITVFGHTPTRHYQPDVPLRVYWGANRIGIDCGSGYPEPDTQSPARGRLACLRLDDRAVFYSDESCAAPPDCKAAP